MNEKMSANIIIVLLYCGLLANMLTIGHGYQTNSSPPPRRVPLKVPVIKGRVPYATLTPSSFDSNYFSTSSSSSTSSSPSSPPSSSSSSTSISSPSTSSSSFLVSSSVSSSSSSSSSSLPISSSSSSLSSINNLENGLMEQQSGSTLPYQTFTERPTLFTNDNIDTNTNNPNQFLNQRELSSNLNNNNNINNQNNKLIQHNTESNTNSLSLITDPQARHNDFGHSSLSNIPTSTSMSTLVNNVNLNNNNYNSNSNNNRIINNNNNNNNNGYGQTPSPVQQQQPIVKKKINRFPLNELVNVIAQAAINGEIPFNKVDLSKPFKMQQLQIPILLLRPDDIYKASSSNNINFKLITAAPIRIPIYAEESRNRFQKSRRPAIHNRHRPRDFNQFTNNNRQFFNNNNNNNNNNNININNGPSNRPAQQFQPPPPPPPMGQGQFQPQPPPPSSRVNSFQAQQANNAPPPNFNPNFVPPMNTNNDRPFNQGFPLNGPHGGNNFLPKHNFNNDKNFMPPLPPNNNHNNIRSNDPYVLFKNEPNHHPNLDFRKPANEPNIPPPFNNNNNVHHNQHHSANNNHIHSVQHSNHGNQEPRNFFENKPMNHQAMSNEYSNNKINNNNNNININNNNNNNNNNNQHHHHTNTNTNNNNNNNHNHNNNHNNNNNIDNNNQIVTKPDAMKIIPAPKLDKPEELDDRFRYEMTNGDSGNGFNNNQDGSFNNNGTVTPKKRTRPVIRIKAERPPIRINSIGQIKLKPERQMRLQPKIKYVNKKTMKEIPITDDDYEKDQSSLYPKSYRESSSSISHSSSIRSKVIPEKYLSKMPSFNSDDDNVRSYKKHIHHDHDHDDHHYDHSHYRHHDGHHHHHHHHHHHKSHRHNNDNKEHREHRPIKYSKSTLSSNEDDRSDEFRTVFRPSTSSFSDSLASQEEHPKTSQTTIRAEGLEQLEKNGYDKQLLKTLKNLMVTGGKRHRLDFEGKEGKVEKIQNKGKIPEKYLKQFPSESRYNLNPSDSSELDEKANSEYDRNESNLSDSHYDERSSEETAEDQSSTEENTSSSYENSASQARRYRVKGYDPNYEYVGPEKHLSDIDSGISEEEQPTSYTEEIGQDGRKVKTYVLTGVYKKKIDEIVRNEADQDGYSNLSEESQRVLNFIKPDLLHEQQLRSMINNNSNNNNSNNNNNNNNVNPVPNIEAEKRADQTSSMTVMDKMTTVSSSSSSPI